jgi:ribosomal protein S19E (S16A)
MARMPPALAEMLKAVDMCAKESPYRVANAALLKKATKKARITIAIRLTQLKKMGLITNPIHGGWVVTPKGRKLLSIISKD